MLTFVALAQRTGRRLKDASPGTQQPARSGPGALELAVSGALGAASLAGLLSPAAGLGAGLCLAALFGAAGGLLVFGLHRLLQRLPAAWLVHAGIGALGGYWGVAAPLGAWSKLRGDHGTMALATLVVSLVGGAGLGASLLAARLYAGTPLPTQRRLLGRVALAATLALLGVLLGMYEATQGWLHTYPAARWALFGSAWWCVSFAACLLVGLLPERRALAGAAALLGVVFVASFAVAASTWSGLARTPHTEHWVKLARTLSDFDRDGSSHWFGGSDCQPFNAKVSPRAREIPGNGVDDNCRYGDAPRARAKMSSDAYVGLPAATLNIVLVTIDALRAHHTTPYGYARNTTPNLQALAASSVRFENAYTSGGWTCLALPSMFSGLYPRRLSWKPLTLTNQRVLEVPWHGTLEPGEKILTTLTLPAQRPDWWLPSALQQRGYRTIAAGNRGIGRVMKQAVQGGWDQVLLLEKAEEDAATVDALLPELAQQKTPFFIWLHLFEAHDPQTEHAGVPRFGDGMLDRYDHEIASADLQLGRLLHALEGRSDTALIVAADHGEAFQWGFQFHGADLNEDSIRIPLLLRAPGLQPGVNGSPASLVDIAPTLLALTGTPPPSGLDGRDLRQLHGDEPVLTDLFRIDAQGMTTVDQTAATTSQVRLVRDHHNQVDLLVRTHDLERPPHPLPMRLAPPQLFEVLGRYQESVGGP